MKATARLYEVHSKKLLKEVGIAVPDGVLVRSVEEAATAVAHLPGPWVAKAQTWMTGRMHAGGIVIASTSQEALEAVGSLLGRAFEGVPCESVLIERYVAHVRELFLGIGLDEAARCPVALFSATGGSDVEQGALVGRLQIDIRKGLRPHEAMFLLKQGDLEGRLAVAVSRAFAKIWSVFARYEARVVEVNPLLVTEDGELFAADCHMIVDDYAVPRHPELNIDVAREFRRPPTDLEKLAYYIDRDDYRGTFYFLELDADRSHPYHVGFHGRGGGGALMVLDLLQKEGLHPANFAETSGNPPASKTYRSAKVILRQEGLQGYFMSGAGASSQEELHTARGLAKAFLEEPLRVPAVIQIRGNSEKEAVALLRRVAGLLDAPLEAYGSETSTASCVSRLKHLIDLIERDEWGK